MNKKHDMYTTTYKNNRQLTLIKQNLGNVIDKKLDKYTIMMNKTHIQPTTQKKTRKHYKQKYYPNWQHR